MEVGFQLIGEVTITKVYKDGRRETVINKDRNMITDGLGIALVNLLCSNPLNPRNRARNYQIGYFQVGTSSVLSEDVSFEVFDNWNGGLIDALGNNFYELSSALESSGYGDATTLQAVTRKIITVNNPFEDSGELEYTEKDATLIVFEDDPVTNINLESGAIRVKIYLDEDCAVGQRLKEFGLFITNPEGVFGRDKPALAAYKTLYNPIIKTDDFSIDIDWAILFNDVDSEDPSYSKVKFKPKVVKNYSTRDSVYATFLDSRASERIYIETPVPVETDTLIKYSLTGDAINNIHYKIAPEQVSGVTIARNTKSTFIEVSGAQLAGLQPPTATDQYSTRTLYLTISSVEGPRGIVDKGVDFLSDKFLVNLLPKYEDGFMESRIDTSATSTSQGYISLSANTVYEGALGNQTNTNYKTYISLSADAGVTLDQSGVVIEIPRNYTAGVVSSIGYTGNGDVSAALINNLLTGSPTDTYDANINKFADSNDFSIPYLFSSVDIDPLTFSDNWADLINPQPGGYYQTEFSWFLPGMHSWYAGDKTLKTYGNVFDYNLYKAKPTRDVFLNHSVSSADAPDKMQDSTLLYQPCALYLWPTQDNGVSSIPAGASRVERSYENSEVDTYGNVVGGQTQKMKFDSSTSTITFSVYFKDFDAFVKDGALLRRSPVVALSIHSLGFDGIEPSQAPQHSNVSKTATFIWNDSTGGLELSSVSGEGAWSETLLEVDPGVSDAGVMSGVGYDEAVFGYADRWASPASKWYRAYITTDVPEDFTNSGYYASFTRDGSGATSQFYIYPEVDSDGNLSSLAGENDGLFTRGEDAPLELSGSVIAWAQWEYPADPGPPTLYSPNTDTEGTPLGSVFADGDDPGYSFITFSVTQPT